MICVACQYASVSSGGEGCRGEAMTVTKFPKLFNVKSAKCSTVLFLLFFFSKSDPRVNSLSNLYSKLSILWHIDTFCKECALTPGMVPDPLV